MRPGSLLSEIFPKMRYTKKPQSNDFRLELKTLVKKLWKPSITLEFANGGGVCPLYVLSNQPVNGQKMIKKQLISQKTTRDISGL